MKYLPTLVPVQFCTQSSSAEGCAIVEPSQIIWLSDHYIARITRLNKYQVKPDPKKKWQSVLSPKVIPWNWQLLVVGSCGDLRTLFGASKWDTTTQPRSFPEPHSMGSACQSGITEIRWETRTDKKFWRFIAIVLSPIIPYQLWPDYSNDYWPLDDGM